MKTEREIEMDKCKPDPESAFETARNRCLEHLAAAQRRVDMTSDEYVFSPVATLFEFAVSAAQMAAGSRAPSTLLDTITAIETELEISEIPGFTLARVLLERAAVFAQDMCDAVKSLKGAK